jgi:MOSC domain-containing protein YiiM
VEAGNSFEFLSRAPLDITIAEMNRLFVDDKYNQDLLNKAMTSPALPEDWRDYFRKRLEGSATIAG